MLALFSCPKEVSITPYLSKDQIAAAREMDLLTYLRRFEPEELVHIGGDTYATRTHDSLKISNGKWCWWSRNIGGTTALDYLTTVEGVSFLDAVQRILGELPRVPTKSEPTAPLPKTEFSLPPKHADTRRVFAYLRSRGIDAEIINHCIKHGQLYEDAERHNCVFVGYLRTLIAGEKMRPRPPNEYAEIRRQLAAIGNNINQIARAVNARGFASGEDIAAITAAQETIWNIAERL